MAIKQFTLSALTGGALVLAYAAWSKWRGGSPQISTAPLSQVGPSPEAELLAPPLADGFAAAGSEPEAIDVVLDDLWSVDDVPPDSKEQLVDFSSDIELDDDEVSVAPEGLGVRWLTRATGAMSPFNRALSVRDEAEAALLDEVPVPSGADASMTPDRGVGGGGR